MEKVDPFMLGSRYRYQIGPVAVFGTGDVKKHTFGNYLPC